MYCAAMDMSKAFDMVEWSELFQTLIDRGVNKLFLRLILYIYKNQLCNVNWCGEQSSNFNVSNGVRQGAVSSAILFAIYIDDLLKILEKSRFGCYIQGEFFGAFIFADDIFLLSASRSGLQTLVDLCHEFATRKNLKFGTNPNPNKSKTKCIIFSKKARDHMGVAQIMLDGVPLPWVKTVSHLGCTLDSENSMKNDISLKRGRYIGKVNSLFQEFHFASPEVLLKLLNTYTTSFYGSQLWDIYSANCEKLYKSWNVSMRNILGIDRRSHRYLLEELTEQMHPKVMLASRLVGFYKTQINSPKFRMRFLVRLAAEDMRTVLGRTLNRISNECNCTIGILTPSLVKRKLRYATVSSEEAWRIQLAKELYNAQNENNLIPGFSTDEIRSILHYVCVS